VATTGKAATAVGSVAAARNDRSCGDGAASGSGAAAAPGSGARKAAGNGAAATVGIEQRLPVAVMATQPAIVIEQRPTVSAMAPQATEVMAHRPAVAVKAPPPQSRDRAASPRRCSNRHVYYQEGTRVGVANTLGRHVDPW
jgi:hypothetical protein